MMNFNCFCEGAGKSKIITSILWYLFQHNASNLVIITSYTWKAADLVATPYNAAYSSCKVAGVNPKRPSQTPGNTADSVALMNGKFVMILDDEISLANAAFLQVYIHKTQIITYKSQYVITFDDLDTGIQLGLPIRCETQLPSYPTT